MTEPINNMDPGWGVVGSLVDVTPGTTFDPPITWIRCEGAGGTVTVVAARDNESAAKTFTLAAQGELRRVAIRKCTAATATGLIGGR